MNIKRQCLIFTLLFASLSGHVIANDYEVGLAALYKKEKSGVKFYKKGSYEKAYEKLIEPAKRGLKSSQHYIGFMYLKGQHVSPSIEEGMAWLGVANEIEVDDWAAIYNSIYERLNEAQQKKVDQKVDEYISLYGMDTQKVNCENKAKLGSRKKQVYCDKRSKVKTTIHQ